MIDRFNSWILGYFIDADSGRRITNATFTWQLVSSSTGAAVQPGFFFAKVTARGGQLSLAHLREDVDLAVSGDDNLYSVCVARIPDSEDGKEARRYKSQPYLLLRKDARGKTEMLHEKYLCTYS